MYCFMRVLLVEKYNYNNIRIIYYRWYKTHHSGTLPLFFSSLIFEKFFNLETQRQTNIQRNKRLTINKLVGWGRSAVAIWHTAMGAKVGKMKMQRCSLKVNVPLKKQERKRKRTHDLFIRNLESRNNIKPIITAQTS